MLYLSCEKNENKQIEAGFGPFKKNLTRMEGSMRGDLDDVGCHTQQKV